MIHKFLLSFLVIGSFAWYSLYEKNILSAQATLPTSGEASVQTANQNAVQPIPADVAVARSDDGEEDDDGPVITKPTPAPVPVKTAPVPVQTTAGKYKDGTYVGDTVDVYYGNVQIKAIISGGKLTNVIFLDYPQDRPESLRKSQNAMPILKREAISVQSSQVDAVSGATETSAGFVQSLASALAKA